MARHRLLTATGAPVALGARSPLLKNLVGYWKLGEAAGTRVDSTGRGNDLTPTGAVTNVAGRVGNAANFGGAGMLTKDDTADLSTGEVDFSFAGWYYHVSGTNTVIATKAQVNPAAAREWTLTVSNDTVPVFALSVWNTVGVAQTVKTEVAQFPGLYVNAGGVLANAWHFIAGGLNTTTGEVWLRSGASIASAAKTVTISDTAAGFGIGAYADGVAYLTGYVDEFGFWKRVLTNAELGTLLNGGVGITHPFSSGSNSGPGVILCHGDSLTLGYNVTVNEAYPAKLTALLNRDTCGNYGMTGLTAATANVHAPTATDPVYLAGIKNVVVEWFGTNDLFMGADAATTWGRIKTYCAARKAVGFKTVALTIVARADVGWTADMETQRGLLNTSIVGGDASIDVIVNVAAAADLQDPNNLTYYQADKIHLTAAGYDVVAPLVRTAINTL